MSRIAMTFRRTLRTKLLGALCIVWVLCSSSLAAQPSPDAESAADPQLSVEAIWHADLIDSVLARDAFGTSETRTGWRLKDTTDKDRRDELFPDWVIGMIEFFEDNQALIANVATVIEVLLWLTLIAAVGWFAWRYRDVVQIIVARQRRSKTAVRELPVSLFGIAITPEHRVNDPVRQAQALWAREDYRGALAVLLTSALVRLLDNFTCDFKSSDTEQECLRTIKRNTPPAIQSYMSTLIGVWIQTAYGHHIPSDAEFTALTSDWSATF